MDSHKRIIDRVRKLLNLSESGNEYEAAAAAAKAQALLAEYNLQMSDIPEDGRGGSATTSDVRTRIKLEKWAFSLANKTAKAFSCDYYHSSLGRTTFVGVGADAEVCAWTFSYLYRSLMRMAREYMRGRRGRGSAVDGQLRESYLMGAVVVVGRRLREQAEQTPVTSDALVLAKDEVVQAAMPENVRQKRFRARNIVPGAAYAGAMDAQDLPLSTPVHGREAQAISEGAS
jgi:hypothetical protein